MGCPRRKLCVRPRPIVSCLLLTVVAKPAPQRGRRVVGANRRLAWTTVLLSHTNRQYRLGATFELRDPTTSNSGVFLMSAYFRLPVTVYRTQLLVAVYPKPHLLAFQIPHYQKKTKATLPLDSPNRLQQTNMGGYSNPKVSKLDLLAPVMSRRTQNRTQTRYGVQYRTNKT